MNETAKLFKMSSTLYSNPHGLCDKANRTSVLDQAKISQIAMKNQTFREIVGKKAHTSYMVADFKNLGQAGTGQLVDYWWTNSNKLLSNKGFIGLKTGFTSTAGSCLSSFFSQNGVELIAIVAGAKSNDHRFSETAKLVQWAYKEILYD
jgi:D-alanyl-D-alanine carboxypeptidase (penicillin-binding protein 5/6)